MSGKIHRLVYYSQNLVGDDQQEFAASIEDILAKSRANNLRDDITGALLFNAGCFAQVLEGPLPVVEAAFERIQQDERHGEVSLLALEPIVARSFPNWAMGFVGASIENGIRFEAVGATSGFDLGRMDGDQINSLLATLAKEEEGTVAT